MPSDLKRFQSFNQDDELGSESYDSNGSVTAAQGKTFSYDTENHLVSMNSGAVQIVYEGVPSDRSSSLGRDGDGNRVKKIVGGVTTTYLVDDLNPTGYPQVVEELTNGAVSRTYTYGLQRISEAQSINGTWTPSFYGYDGLGTVRQLTDSTGHITDSYDYDAYGNKINSTGTTPNNYLYRGEQYDSDLSLYYLRARYYNPQTGRFISEDPIGMRGGINVYQYVGGDPINYVDPFGTDKGGPGGCSDPAGCAPYNPFKQWWKDVTNCVGNYGWPTLARDLNPIPSGDDTAGILGSLQSLADQAKQNYMLAVGAYSVGRGLTVPLRSGVVRGGLKIVEGLGKASDVLLDGVVAWAGFDAIREEWNNCL